ncbi:MAG TPA: ADYC domain-containing protein, partial [Polyangia bacterium]|nr:ADYC domain-containing protein [Polyangia bacterium]
MNACTADSQCTAPAKCVSGSCSSSEGSVTLFISDVEKDTQQNTSKDPSNGDIYLYTVYYRQPATGQWAALCPNDVSGKPHAIATPMDLHDWTTDASRAKFTFACTASGVAAKCARNWGYKPWKTVTEPVWNGSAFVDQSYSLAPFYDACVIAARADYCQDGQSFTKNGTLVDLFDTLDGFTSINATVGLPYAPYAPGIMMHEEYQISVAGHVRDVLSDAQFMSLSPADQQLVLNLHRSGMESSRYPDLDPGRSCAAAPYVDRCDPKEPYACYRATNMSTVPYGPFLAVNSPRHCSHDEATQGEALDPLCNECVNRICNVDPTCCADPGTGFYPGSLVWDGRCRAIGDQVCRSVPGEGAVNRWPLGNPPPPATGGAKTFLSGALGSFEGIVSQGGGADGGAGSAALFAEGWSCDPDFPASANPVQISVGGALGDSGATLFTTVANLPLAPAWRDTVNDACGGAGRHGFRFALPAGSEGKDIYVYGIDLNVPGAPFSLLRGGKKTAPGGSDPLPAPRAAIWTGWVEPGTSGNYTFTASAGSTDKYRVWVNGTYLAGNWIDPDPTVPGAFTLPAPTTPPVQFLQKGVRYGVRIEYLRTASLPADSAFSLLWSLNGAAAQSIPTSALHPVGQGNGNGLEGSFFAGDFSGSTLPATTALPQTIGVVDQVWTDGIPPTTGLTVNQTFAARFAGQVVPPISGDYTFTADTDGNARIWVNGVLVTDADASKAPPGLDKDTCNHDICRTGEAVSRTCKQGFFCASQICLTDPSCCSITWDAHCVQQVADVCQLNCSPTPPVPITLSAGVKYDIRVEYQHVGGDPTPPAITVRGAHLRLMWALPGGPRDVIPVERLFASTAAPATTSGVGINAAFFSDADFKVEYLDRVQASLGFAAASPPDGSLPGTLIDGNPGPVAGPAAPSLGLDHLSGQVATLRGGGAAPGAVVKIFEGSTQLGGDLAIAADGSDGGTFTVNVTLALGAHTLTAIQYVSSVASPPA